MSPSPKSEKSLDCWELIDNHCLRQRRTLKDPNNGIKLNVKGVDHGWIG